MSRTSAPEYVLLLSVLGVRLQHLTSMPLFFDELFHIEEIRRLIMFGEFLNAPRHGRFLNIVLMAPFHPMGAETSWLIRAVTVVLALLTAASCAWLARWIGGRHAGRVALLLYGLLPYAFFYDRQALADPLAAMFGMLGSVFTVRMVRSLHVRDATLAGIAFAGAVLTKFTALMYLSALPAAVLLLPPTTAQRRKVAALSLASGITTAVIIGGIYGIARLSVASNDQLFTTYHWCHSPQCRGEFDLARNLELTRANLRLYAETIPTLFSYPIWLLAVASVVPLAQRRNSRHILFLLIQAFGLAVPYILVADYFPTRYLTVTLASIAALAAVSLTALWHWTSALHVFAQRPIAMWLAWAIIMIVVTAPALAITSRILFAPLTMTLPPFELPFYAAGWPGGVAGQRITTDLLKEQQAIQRRINVVATGLRSEIYGNWGESNGMVLQFDDSAPQQTEIVPWLANGDPLYFAEELPRNPLPEHPHGTVLELTQIYDLPGSGDWPGVYEGPSVVKLWKVIGTTSDMSKKIADYVFGDPAKLAGDYASIADYLNSVPDAPVLLYPPNQANVLQSTSVLDASRLWPVANSWPVDFNRVETELEQMTQGAKDAWVVMVFEGRGDPQRRIETWLNTHLYQVNEQWLGPVRVLRYSTAVNANEAKPQTIDMVFADRIELSAVTILDPAVQPGGTLRLALTWHWVAAADVSYKVFSHVFNDQGQLIARHDGIPQGGLAPTNVWKPGQVVTDRFAIALPPDLPVGVYVIRVGLYEPASGQRLLTTGGVAPGIDSLEIGQVEITK